MKVLVVGKGGREHSIVWKISQSKLVEKIYCAPGNAGIAQLAECVPIDVGNFEALKNFALNEKIDLTVVGPEDPLARGIVDEFEKAGLKILGPRKNAAEIEASKVFSRALCKKYKIPQPWFEIFESAEEAKKFLRKKGAPIVVKADGLAAGKGAIVCDTMQEAEAAIEKIMVAREFGNAGDKVILEQKLVGEECSFIVFTDGKTIRPMVSSQDHKPVFDNDKGPNTGGMGCYSPAPVVTKAVEKKIMEKIMKPVVKAMAKEGRHYRGVLYAGLMIEKGNPFVIEFNCRMGDPENQVIMPRLESDLVPILQACIDGNLAEREIKWKKDACTCVVMASGGYPGNYEKGKEIFGLSEAAKLPNTIVFHAGTKFLEGEIVTDGGRVLGVTALGKDIKASIDNAYRAVGKISFKGAHFRRDIGQKALRRLK